MELASMPPNNHATKDSRARKVVAEFCVHTEHLKFVDDV
jgi:hypothetical protein